MTFERVGNGPAVVVIRPAYSIREFCEAFSIGRSAAYLEIKAGRLPIFKIGSTTRIAGEDALAWRDALRRRPREQP